MRGFSFPLPLFLLFRRTRPLAQVLAETKRQCDGGASKKSNGKTEKDRDILKCVKTKGNIGNVSQVKPREKHDQSHEKKKED